MGFLDRFRKKPERGLDTAAEAEGYTASSDNATQPDALLAIALMIDPTWLDEEDSVSSWCSVLDGKWKAQGACVAAFDIDSDSYVLFPCRIAQLEELMRCAKQLGRRIALAKNTTSCILKCKEVWQI